MDPQTADLQQIPQQKAAPGDLLSRLKAADQRIPEGAVVSPDDGFCDFAERGRSRVLVVLLARLISMLLPGRANWFTAPLSVILMGAWPYLVIVTVAATTSASPLSGTAARFFALAVSLNNIAMLTLGWVAWRSTSELATCMSELLATSPQRRAFTGWLHDRLGIGRQLAACAAGAAAALLLMYAISSQQASVIQVNGWLYLLAAWSGLLGGNVLYWLYTAAEVPLRLHRCEDLRMAWIDPAHTPAVVKLCGTYARIAVSMALGVVLIELATMAVTADRPPALMRVFVIGFPVFAVITAFHVGVQPYVTLSRIVRRHVDQIVSPLMAQMHRPPSDLLLHQDLEGAFRAYGHFRTLHRLPVRTAALLQYAAGILASLIVYFVQPFVR